MAPIPFVRFFPRYAGKCMSAFFVAALALTLAMFAGRVEAQTVGSIALGGNVCADVDSASTTPGASVISWGCSGGANQ